MYVQIAILNRNTEVRKHGIQRLQQSQPPATIQGAQAWRRIVSVVYAVTPASAVERALTLGGALWEEEAHESCSNRKGEGYHLWRSNASCHGISGAHLRATVYRRKA
ncbi:hypothetical protein CEXT_552711 [Caerostris extrusa]|uniref:Uncharacterized protein n=1 Tax=Caerostris extrusa TaxID=172846 RepID=A0AAV4NBS3_CAEEX|nr:hypothetical protein CEXT_552711 [Caerostris extrusa]